MKYAIQINLRDGTKRWLSYKSGSPRLVRRPGMANHMEETIARIVSEYYWEHNWDQVLFYSRELYRVKSKGKR